MTGKTTDRRVRKTKRQLKQTLTRLLRNKSLKDISVLELTELADVNRGTFYLHYRDIYDLYEQLENEILTEFTSIIKKHLAMNNRGIPFPIVLEAFEFLSGNADVCLAILNTNGTEFLSKLIEMNKPDDKRGWQALFGTEYDGFYEYCYSYITSGCVGLLRSWFSAGMKEPPAKMAALAEKLMSNSIGQLKMKV